MEKAIINSGKTSRQPTVRDENFEDFDLLPTVDGLRLHLEDET